MVRKTIAWLAIGLLLVLATGCGALPFDAAATAFGPTDPAPAGTSVRGTATMAITPEALLANAIQREGEEHRYTFMGEGGQAVTVEMQAPSGGWLDSLLELYGPDGTLLTSNDDGGTGIDSLIFNYVLPETGEYTILATGFLRTSTGNYSLQMALGTPIPTPTVTPTPEPGGGEISVGSLNSGAINGASQVDEWFFDAAAGDIVTLRMETTGAASALDPYIELLGPDGNVLRVDDDSGSGLDSRIADFTLPEDGRYTIRASGQSGSTGIYNLVLREGVPPTPTLPPPTAGPSPTPFDREILLGVPVEAELRPNVGGDIYILQVDQPMVVEVLLETDEEFNLYLEMTEPVTGAAYLVEYSNASPVVYLPSIFLRMAGQYTFRVQAVESRFVNYALTINRVAANTSRGGQIAYGQGLSGSLTFSGQEDVWTFEGQAGDRVTIIMKGIGMDSYLQLLDENGSQLASNDDAPGTGSLDARIDRVRLAEDGTYTIVASSFRSGSFGPYRLLLFRDAE